MPITRTDLNNVFGTSNITMWADVNNDRDSAEIAARIDYAIAVAIAEASAILRNLSYDVDDALDHILVKNATALRAGDVLYTPRRFSELGGARMLTTTDLMTYHRKEYLNFFKNLQANTIDLGLPRNSRPYPAVAVDAVTETYDGYDYY